jgi:hypothetical protein
MISVEKAKEILKSNGIQLATMAADPQVFNQGCHRVYKTIPISWRWFIGKQRIEKVLNKLVGQGGAARSKEAGRTIADRRIKIDPDSVCVIIDTSRREPLRHCFDCSAPGVERRRAWPRSGAKHRVAGARTRAARFFPSAIAAAAGGVRSTAATGRSALAAGAAT